MTATAVFLCEQQLLQSVTTTTTLARTGTQTLEATARLHTDNERLKSELEKMRSRLAKVEAELQALKQDQYDDRPYGWSIRAVRDTVARCLNHDIASPSKAKGLPPLIVAQLDGYRAWNYVQTELVAAREKGWTADMAMKAGVPREVLLTVVGFAEWMLSD